MKKKKQLWGKNKIFFVADSRRKGHNRCSRSRRWSGCSSDGILGLEFDRLQKLLWRTEGMLW